MLSLTWICVFALGAQTQSVRAQFPVGGMQGQAPQAQVLQKEILLLASAYPDAPLPQPDSQAQTTQGDSSLRHNATPGPAQVTGSPSEPETAEQKRAEAARELKREEAQRILGVVPNFNSVMGGQALPLTPGQKWNLAFHSSTDPFYMATAAVLAGYSEIRDTHTGYGWGPAGYFKRAGANYADTVNGALIGNALLPVLLKQDPRYFRKGTGTVKTRIVYSALTTIICRGDNGNRQFNLSNVAGNFISGAISNAYYPANERGVGLTVENAATVTAEGSLGSLFLEFAPDVIRHYSHKHATGPSAASGSNSVPPQH